MSLLFVWLLAFTTAQAQTFDLYEAAHPKSPVLVFVHGGAWQSGSKADYRNLGERFKAQGFCGVIVDYTLSHAKMHPTPIQDLQSILEELKKVSRPGCDFKSLFLIGHSAGAHMIAFWSTQHNNPNVLGKIGLEGIYDLPSLAKVWPTYPDWFVKKEFGEAQNWSAASPSELSFKSKSPWLVVHSQGDELVDLGQATSFVEHLKNTQIEVQFLKLKSEKHDEVVEELGRPDTELWKAIREFTRKHQT